MCVCVYCCVVSAGDLHSLRVYPQALSNVDIELLAGIDNGPLHFAPACRCPPSHSVIRSLLSQTCESLDDSSSVRRLTAASRDAGFLNDDSASTPWISAIGTRQADITMSLGGVRHVLYFQLTFTSARPQAMVVEKSSDNGLTWSPLQYYASDCVASFNLRDNGVLASSTGVQCSNLFSAASSGVVTFNLLNSVVRPNSTRFDQDTGLQLFAQATHLRARLLTSHVTSTCTSDQYYAVSDWVVTGNPCVCNGHASTCSGSVCNCQHNTAGSSCQLCQPLYNNRPWLAGTVARSNPCEACACNNHSSSCQYSSALGRGACESCQHFTTGTQCESCITNYYHPSSTDLTSVSACQPCNCFAAGITNGGDCRRGDLASADSGQCACKSRVTGRQCDTCTSGYYNLALRNADGCQACSCNTVGTIAGNSSCQALTGQCYCKANVDGLQCQSCLTGFYDLANPRGCQPCHTQCSSAGCSGAGPSACVVRTGSLCNFPATLFVYHSSGLW